MKRRKKRYVSIFSKTVIAFFALGFIPLLTAGLGIYNKNIKEAKSNLINNAYQMTKIIKDDVESLLEEVGIYSKYLYEYEVDEYGYFYDIMLNTDISDILKENLIEDALKMILYRNEYIDNVYFIGSDGSIYSSTKAPEKMVSQAGMQEWGGRYCSKEKNAITVVPTHEISYFLNTDEKDFTFVRNIMNIQSIQTAGSEVLGTLFIDIRTDCFQKILDEISVDTSDQFFVADQRERSSVFSSYEEKAAKDDQDVMWQNVKSIKEKFCLALDGMYLIGHPIEGTEWVIVEKIPLSDFERLYRTIVRSTLWVILLSIFLLLILYYYNSKTIEKPIRMLKNAMDKIKAGNLNTRVELTTNDELGVLADGLNSMTEQLRRHIEKVYIAEIKQKEAHIGALMAQIQPHYLYNTLDVIRMSAISNDDLVTARMLESLSGQMRYLISDNRSMVDLQEEIDSIRNYFIIVSIRYENTVHLEIDVERELLQCKIPRLTLQPIVENSVKYGISPNGRGTIAIYAKKIRNSLELSVLDDGVGMDKGTLEHTNKVLQGVIRRKESETKKFSIGLKNVEDRIKLHFGEAYGIELLSTPGMGTCVQCHLPVIYGKGEG